MRFVLLDGRDDKEAERIATMANGIMDLCLAESEAPWEGVCAIVNVLGFLIRESGPAGEDMCEGRLGDVVKNLRVCARQSRSH